MGDDSRVGFATCLDPEREEKREAGREKKTAVYTPTSAFSTMSTFSVLVFAVLQRRAASSRVGNSSRRILTSLMAFIDSLISSRPKGSSVLSSVFFFIG
ncbi:hypothetical protein AVEN_81462-1 [Araneus ventricosus]|uniref:Uncharacterized protein n=1 Tax=Araneus ventricosus TaxID=182803 RepID=A0A4Y2E167_ARAVE|nr:hypothetical protein AVEN_81462-1 [Araneus ventricosus]